MPSRRLAKLAVNSGGMCCTMTVPGASPGMPPMTWWSASVPPVDAPIASSREVVRPSSGGAALGGRRAGGGWRPARGCTRAAAAARSVRPSTPASSATLYAEPGLHSTSTAPSS